MSSYRIILTIESREDPGPLDAENLLKVTERLVRAVESQANVVVEIQVASDRTGGS